MPQNFLFPQRDQPLLMPVDMREWLPEDDLAFVVLDAVATLDLGEFRRLYRADGHGRAAFDPAQIEKVLAEAAAADVAGDAKHGSSPPPATPRTLARRAGRRERLARARDRLAAEDKARRDAQRAKQEAWDAAAAAGKRRGRRPADEPPRANRAGTGPRANTTGPDVRVMRNQKGYVAGYNGQIVVTADQVIVGAMLSQHPAGRTLLHPLLDTCREQLTGAGIRPKLRTVLAGSGYVSEENFARATRRMRHHRGKEDYKLRARTVEPVFGQLKTCQEQTTMSRRGLTACESEWLLACTAHNLRKLHRHRAGG